MKNEELKQVYGMPSEGFHARVVDTLNSLESSTAAHSHRSSRKKLVTVFVAAAVIATLTVTAAATNMFGLFATRTGTYGLNVKVASDDTKNTERQSIKLKFDYMPPAYKGGESLNSCFIYTKNDSDYFNAWIYDAQNYDYDYTNVIKTSETEYDGHKTLIVTFKEAENTDKLFYATFKYFDEYQCLVRCNGSDYDELIKITEKVEVEPNNEESIPEDLLDDETPYRESALDAWSRDYDGFRDEYFAGKVKEVNIGDTMQMSVADFRNNPVNISAKVTSVKEQDNTDGLDSTYFKNLGRETTYSMFFNPDGSLIKEKEETMYEDSDENHLGTARKVTFTRHFFVAEMELTAQDDIDDLRQAFGMDAQAIDTDKNFYYGSSTLDGDSALLIYGTNINDTLSLKKGETRTIQLGIIAENDLADHTYIAVSAVDAQNSLYQNYMVKLKK